MWRGEKNHILQLCHCFSAGKMLEIRKMILFSYILNSENGSIGKPLSPRKDIPLRKVKSFPALSNHMPFLFSPLTDQQSICQAGYSLLKIMCYYKGCGQIDPSEHYNFPFFSVSGFLKRALNMHSHENMRGSILSQDLAQQETFLTFSRAG